MGSLNSAASLHYVNPTNLLQMVADASRPSLNDTGTSDVSTAAAFWTTVGNWGAAVDSNFSADTWKTIANLTGPGRMYAAIGPTASNNADITSMRFTRDGGSAVTITFTMTASGNRALLIATGGLRSDAFTTGSQFSYGGGQARIDSNRVHYNTAFGVEFMPQEIAEGLGARCYDFASSLLVEMKITNAVTGTVSNERQAGVLWRKLS